MSESFSAKIYWYGFTRQLNELYSLLFFERFISCEWDEFFTHFTGKKFTITPEPKRKLKWKGDKYSLALILSHLIEKRFLNSSFEENITIMKRHFENFSGPVLNEFEKNKKKPAAKRLQLKIDSLFPATSGYRCKERLFYRARNKKPQPEVLKNSGIELVTELNV